MPQLEYSNELITTTNAVMKINLPWSVNNLILKGYSTSNPCINSLTFSTFQKNLRNQNLLVPKLTAIG